MVPAFFFFNDTATTEIYTLSLHDALPISRLQCLEAAPVILAGDGPRWQHAFGRAHDEPQGEQPVPLGPARRRRDQRDEALFGGRGGAGHPARRSPAAAPAAGGDAGKPRGG